MEFSGMIIIIIDILNRILLCVVLSGMNYSSDISKHLDASFSGAVEEPAYEQESVDHH